MLQAACEEKNKSVSNVVSTDCGIKLLDINDANFAFLSEI